VQDEQDIGIGHMCGEVGVLERRHHVEVDAGGQESLQSLRQRAWDRFGEEHFWHRSLPSMTMPSAEARGFQTLTQYRP